MLKDMKRIWYIFNNKQKKRFLCVALMTLLGGAVELLGISAILPFINAITNPEKIVSNSFLSMLYEGLNFTNQYSFIVFLAIGLVGVYILKNLYLCVMYYVQYSFSNNNRRRVSGVLMNYYMNKPYVYYLKHDSAELIRNVHSDAAMLFGAVTQLIHLLTEGVVCLFILGYLLYMDKSITIAVGLAMGVFMLLFFNVMHKREKELGIERRSIEKDINKYILQAFGGIKEIKLVGREKFFINRYDYEQRNLARNGNVSQMYDVVPKPIMETVGVAALLGSISIKILMKVDITYFIPVISTFAVAAFRLMPSVSRIVNATNSLMFNRTVIKDVYDVFVEINKENKNGIDNNFKEKMLLNREIQIKNVTFRYPDANQDVLKDVNFVIPKNSSVAFVGASGGGKTTLADIILGILNIEKGEVLVDGVNIQENIRGWNNNIGYIPQNIYISDDSIRNNIAFGIEEEDIDDKKIWNAIQGAQLTEYVSNLDDGIYTEVGERGARMSGGQRQRIGIARALYNNPEILVLDEATSALDVETEKAVMDAFNNLKGEKTLIIIAHRLSTIQGCDYIYRVQGGQVIRESE